MVITVGVPAHNAEPRIAECLANIQAASDVDLEILVSANGCTDRTEEICRDIAATDSRIKVYVPDGRLVMRDNFRLLLDKASGARFHWRCDDDLTDQSFLAHLSGLLDGAPSAGMAGGSVEIIHTHSGKRHNRLTYPQTLHPSPARRVDAYFIQRRDFHACDWFYGLWDTSYLRETVDMVWNRYPSENLWGTDGLTALRPVMEGRFVSDPDVCFRKRIIRGQRFQAKPLASKDRLAGRYALYEPCRQTYLALVEASGLPDEDKRQLRDLAVRFSRRTLNIGMIKRLRHAWHRLTDTM